MFIAFLLTNPMLLCNRMEDNKSYHIILLQQSSKIACFHFISKMDTYIVFNLPISLKFKIHYKHCTVHSSLLKKLLLLLIKRYNLFKVLACSTT